MRASRGRAAILLGVSNQFGDTMGKVLQLLTQVRAGISRVGFFWVPDNPANRFNKVALEAIAPQLGVTIEPIEVKASEDFDSAFAAVGVLIVQSIRASGITHHAGIAEALNSREVRRLEAASGTQQRCVICSPDQRPFTEGADTSPSR